MESNRNTTIQVYGGEAYRGPQGIQGPMGPQGPQGEQGPVGPKGADGINGKDGRDGIDGKDGQDGKGIKSITLIDTKDRVKTYRIEYTDGTSFDFQVKDGEDGKGGKDGMSGGAILKGAEKTSRKSQDYTDNSKETYPSSYALAAAVTQLRSEIPTDYIQIRRVDELPEEGEANVLYLVPSEDPDTNNIYNEYIWTIQEDESYAWELIGSTEIDLSGYATETWVEQQGYESKATVTALSATDSITLADNTIYNGGNQTALTIALPATDAVGFLCEVVFTSASTATTMSYPNTIKWIGDEVSSNVFTPTTNKRYTIMIYYDGSEYVAIVKGVA